MTYGELKNRVLQLIFSYSIAGDKIELDYNNQADYVKQIPGLLNSVQTQVYQIKSFYDSVMMKDLEKEEQGNMTLYHLPDDCLEIVPGLVDANAPFNAPRFHRYKLIAGNKLLMRSFVADNFLLEYKRRAVPIPQNVPDSYKLKNPDEVNECFPWYIAAYCVMYDDAFRYSALKNEYETMLQRMRPNPTIIESSEIVDVYGGFDGGGLGWHM